MPDIYLSINDFNRAIQTLTIQVLGITFANANDKAPYQKVRVGWPQTGAPAFEIAEDVAFLRSVEVDNWYNRQRHVVLEDAPGQIYDTMTTYYTRVMEVFWIFYGPNSFDHAQALRDQLFYQQIHDLLVASNLYFVPDPPAPRRVPELFQGQWWERTDWSAHFYEQIARQIQVPFIREVPVTVENKDGIQATLDIVYNP